MTPAGMIEQLNDWFHREFPDDEHDRWRIMFSGVQTTDSWVLLIKWSVGKDKTGDLYSKRTFGPWEIGYCPPEVALGILSQSLAEMREEIIGKLDAQLERKREA